MQISDLILTTSMLAAGWLVPLQEEDPPEMRPSLTVSGDAEVAAEPDLAVVRLGATAQAPAAATAQQQVNEVMQRAISAIREAGVPEKQIQTTGLSLQPVYSHPRRGSPDEEPQEPKIIAYRASNTVRVEVDDIASVGPVIDAGIGAGANELQGIFFELKDDTPQRAQALRQAVKSARHKADALAEAAGVRLLAIQHIQEGGVQIVSPMSHRAEAMAFEASTPIQPGQVQVSASVTLTYRIAPSEDQKDEEDER